MKRQTEEKKTDLRLPRVSRVISSTVYTLETNSIHNVEYSNVWFCFTIDLTIETAFFPMFCKIPIECCSSFHATKKCYHHRQIQNRINPCWKKEKGKIKTTNKRSWFVYPVVQTIIMLNRLVFVLSVEVAHIGNRKYGSGFTKGHFSQVFSWIYFIYWFQYYYLWMHIIIIGHLSL